MSRVNCSHSKWCQILLEVPWIVVFLVFLFSGASKIFFPSGTAPRFFGSIEFDFSYQIILQSLGIFEVLLGASVLWPKLRKWGLWLSLIVLIGFSLFVSFNSTDVGFVNNCGCFGKLSWKSTYFGWLVLRNSGIICLCVLGIRLGEKGWGASLRLAIWGLFLSLSIPVAIGEMGLRLRSYRAIDSLARSNRYGGFQGQLIPEFFLYNSDGREISSLSALEGGDILVFLSSECPHCRELTPDLEKLHQSVHDSGERIVLIFLDGPIVPAGWPMDLSEKGIPVFASVDRIGQMLLGVLEVPRFVVLGPDKEIVFNEAFPHSTSLWKSLNLLDGRIEGISDSIWLKITEKIFSTEDLKLGPLLPADSVLKAHVYDEQNSQLGDLFVTQDRLFPGKSVELAIGVSPDGRIKNIVPLSAGAYVRVFSPDIEEVKSFQGLSLSEADSLAAERANNSGIKASIWAAIRQSIQRVEKTWSPAVEIP